MRRSKTEDGGGDVTPQALSGEFGRAAKVSALASLGPGGVAEWAADLKEAEKQIYLAEVFGSATARPTLAKGRDWLVDQTGVEMDDERKVLVAGAVQWLQRERGWRLTWKPDERADPVDCTLTALYRKKLGARRFRLREVGDGGKTAFWERKDLLPGLSLER